MFANIGGVWLQKENGQSRIDSLIGKSNGYLSYKELIAKK